MNCEDAANLANARLDGGLGPEETALLEIHLGECPACRAMVEATTLQDAMLRRAFAGRREAARELAERVIERMPGRRQRRIPWLAMGLSAAAGFAVAFAALRATMPIQRTVSVASTLPLITRTTQPSVAHLSLATGAVQFRCPGDAAWSAMPTGGTVPAGTKVRTGADVRCELVTADGSAIRMNANTEVAIASPRKFELSSGQTWSTVAHRATDDPFEAKAQAATFTALGTQFDLSLAEPTRVMLTVAEGKVKVGAAGASTVVDAGEQLTVAEGRLGDKQSVSNLAVATRWVNEILVMKGRDDPELAKRVDDLFAQIGQQKMSFMYEEEIRSLGDHCVIPLVRFIESDRSKDESAKRAVAARIVSDVAPAWAIPELIDLLADRSGEVRYYAALALHRLTGRDVGRSPDQWRADSWAACVAESESWKQWWGKNRERFPGVGPMQTPSEEKAPPVNVAKERAPLKKG